jgi:hypothetical protein
MSPFAVKLLVDLAAQYKGSNNGDLCAAWSVMHPRGWRSKETLFKSLRELEHYGMIERTRQGGRKRATLYAITWRAIDYCGGKLDVSCTRSPSGTWKNIVEPFDGRGARRGTGRIASLTPPAVPAATVHGSDSEPAMVH